MTYQPTSSFYLLKAPFIFTFPFPLFLFLSLSLSLSAYFVKYLFAIFSFSKSWKGLLLNKTAFCRVRVTQRNYFEHFKPFKEVFQFGYFHNSMINGSIKWVIIKSVDGMDGIRNQDHRSWRTILLIFSRVGWNWFVLLNAQTHSTST